MDKQNHVYRMLQKLCSLEANQYTISYSWINADGIRTTVQTKIGQLYRDWYNQANLCPENDAMLVELKISTQTFSAEELSDVSFGHLMEAIKEIWMWNTIPLICQEDLDVEEAMLQYINENFSVSREFSALTRNIISYATAQYPNIDDKMLFLQNIFDGTIGLTSDDYAKMFA